VYPTLEELPKNVELSLVQTSKAYRQSIATRDGLTSLKSLLSRHEGEIRQNIREAGIVVLGFVTGINEDLMVSKSKGFEQKVIDNALIVGYFS